MKGKDAREVIVDIVLHFRLLILASDWSKGYKGNACCDNYIAFLVTINIA